MYLIVFCPILIIVYVVLQSHAFLYKNITVLHIMKKNISVLLLFLT